VLFWWLVAWLVLVLVERLVGFAGELFADGFQVRRVAFVDEIIVGGEFNEDEFPDHGFCWWWVAAIASRIFVMGDPVEFEIAIWAWAKEGFFV